MIELMLQAERALSMGLVDQAEQLYWQAVESDGRNVIAIVGLAKVALARGDDRTALQFAQKALELDPEDGAAVRLVERLEDLARLRIGSDASKTAPAGAPGVEPGSSAGDAVAGLDAARAGAGIKGPSDIPAPAPAPGSGPRRSRADIEWPSTDVLGAAPSAPPRTVPARAATVGGGAVSTTTAAEPGAATGGSPAEPTWPATLPRAQPSAPTERHRPLPQRPPPEPEKKRGLFGRFRKNG